MDNALLDKMIVVTRAAEQSEGLIESLRARGAEVLHIPTISMVEPSSWEDCDEALSRLDSYDWIVFTSSNGVRFFLQHATDIGQNIKFYNAKVAAVGEHTANRLLDAGISVSLIPERFDTAGLVDAFKKWDLMNKRILLPAAAQGRDLLVEELTKLGAVVHRVPVYENRFVPEDVSAQVEVLRRENPDVLTFTSPSSFRNFVSVIGDDLLTKWMELGSKIAVIGDVTRAAVSEAGYEAAIVPSRASISDLVEAIFDHYDG